MLDSTNNVKYYILDSLNKVSDVNFSPSTISSSSLFSKVYVSESVSPIECDNSCRNTEGCYGSQFEFTSIEETVTDLFGNTITIPAKGRCSFSYHKFLVSELTDLSILDSSTPELIVPMVSKKNYINLYDFFGEYIYNGIYESFTFDAMTRSICEEICNGRWDCFGYNFLITRDCNFGFFGEICNENDVGECGLIKDIFNSNDVSSSVSRYRIFLKKQLGESIVTVNPQFNDVTGNLIL